MENFRLRLLYVIATDFVEDNFVKMADIQLSNILENFKQEDRDITNFYPIASFIVSSNEIEEEPTANNWKRNKDPQKPYK